MKLFDWMYKIRISRAAKVLGNVDDYLKSKGYKRNERRQFWKEMISKNTARSDVFERLMK